MPARGEVGLHRTLVEFRSPTDIGIRDWQVQRLGQHVIGVWRQPGDRVGAIRQSERANGSLADIREGRGRGRGISKNVCAEHG